MHYKKIKFVFLRCTITLKIIKFSCLRNSFFYKSCLASFLQTTWRFLCSGPHEFITKCSVVYARLSPRGSRTIDRMTNVLGSRRLHRGLVNQEIFSISMFREALLFFTFSCFFLFPSFLIIFFFLQT